MTVSCTGAGKLRKNREKQITIATAHFFIVNLLFGIMLGISGRTPTR